MQNTSEKIVEFYLTIFYYYAIIIKVRWDFLRTKRSKKAMYNKEILGYFHLYGLMIGVGLLAAFAVLFYTAKKKKFDEKFIDFVFYNGIASIAVGFGAAALFQAFYNYLDNPKGGFKVGEGITFIGGLIGGIVCFLAVYFIFRKRYKTRLIDVVSTLPACIIIGHVIFLSIAVTTRRTKSPPSRTTHIMATCITAFLGIMFVYNSLYSFFLLVSLIRPMCGCVRYCFVPTCNVLRNPVTLIEQGKLTRFSLAHGT